MDSNRLRAQQQRTRTSIVNRLFFNGDNEKFELWHVKFMAYLRLQCLTVEENAEDEDDTTEEKNAQIFALLVQFLDDKSLSLIIRDARDNGTRALEILTDHYVGNSKPRIIALYTELTTLRMAPEESVTNYIIRAEKAAASLKCAGEIISDSLLIAMVLKRLPEEYKAFSTVITQKNGELKFTDFKTSLRSYEESEKCRKEKDTATSENKFMKIRTRPEFDREPLKCFNCGKPGHKRPECYSKTTYSKKEWCKISKNASHGTENCRRKNSAKKKFCEENGEHRNGRK